MDLHLRAMKALQANGRGARRRSGAATRPGGSSSRSCSTVCASRTRSGSPPGYDKNAAVYPAFEAHFSPGFVEVGTVTLRPQGGNPRPRIHRLPGGHLVNAMGFPNAGAEAVAAHLRTLPSADVPLGVNVGKLKATPDADAPAEYAEVVRRFADLGERAPAYLVVNVSSPNTPGLRALQEVGRLGEILDAVTAVLDAFPGLAPRPRRRLLVKLAPELTPDDVEAVVGLVLRYDTGGLILTNTRAADDRPRRGERTRAVRAELGDGQDGGRAAAGGPGDRRDRRGRLGGQGLRGARPCRPRRRLHGAGVRGPGPAAAAPRRGRRPAACRRRLPARSCGPRTGRR